MAEDLSVLTRPADDPADAFDDSLAARSRDWYLEAKDSEFWKKYIPKAEENRGYYVGGKGQWSYDGKYDDWEALAQEGRARVSIDRIGPVIDILTGFEESNRVDLKTEPVGNEDVEDAEVMSWLLKQEQEQTELQEHRSDGFEDALIEGMTCYKWLIDYDEDVRGRIKLSRLRPGFDVIWDPNWKEYDLSDARYILEWGWYWVEDVVAQHPDHEKRIREALGKLSDVMTGLTPKRSTDGGASAYGIVGDHVVEDLDVERQFYRPEDGKVLVLEVWYRDYQPFWVVTDKDTGKVEEFESSEAAKLFAKSDPKRLTAIKRARRLIRTGTVLPATRQTLEDGETPHVKDKTNYPYVPEIAKRKGDDILGAIDKLKDPQRVDNKRISQALDLAARWLKIRMYYWEGSMTPMAEGTLGDPNADSPIPLRPGYQPPGFLIPQGLSEATSILTTLAGVMESATRESGVNAELQGITEKGNAGQSGIAIARKQAQGQVMNTRFFNNHRRTGKILGQRLARLIQQVRNYDDVVRLKDDLGEAHLVHLNPMGMKSLDPETRRQKREEFTAKGFKVLADIDSLKYDLVIAETPATVSARQAQLQALMEVLDKYPDIMPDVVDVIFELLNIPKRGEILRRIRARQAALGAGVPPAGGPPSPVGGPPGAATAPTLPQPPSPADALGAPVAA